MINIIAAVSQDGFIANQDGKIPWRLKSDMDHFVAQTNNHSVIMGRNTWESLSPKFRPLPGRRNIVVSQRPDFIADGAEVVHSTTMALAVTNDDEEVFVIGGEQVYRHTLLEAERLIITRVNMIVGIGRARFPNIHPDEWKLVSQTPGVRTGKDEYNFAIEDYTPNLEFIELANVRTLKQLQEYRLIREQGHCPFCQDNLPLYHNNPILRKGKYWLLTQNDYPYAGTDAHLLLILREHAENFRDLLFEAQQELFTFITDVEAEGKFQGGGLCARAGDPLLSGASVKHLHFHLIAPTKGAQPIAFFMGKGKR